MRLFSITAGSSVSPHTNPPCRWFTLTRLPSSIHPPYPKQNTGSETTYMEQKELQRVSWALRHQTIEARSCCVQRQEKARVGRCYEALVRAVVTIDAPHGAGKVCRWLVA